MEEDNQEQEQELGKNLRVLAKSSIIVFASIVFTKILSYAYRIIIARNYGPEAYGLFTIALMIASWIIIFSKVGFTGGIIRFVSRYRGEKQMEKAGYAFKISLFIMSLIGVTAGILLFIFSSIISIKIFHNPALAIYLKVFAIIVPLTIILDTYLSLLLAFEKIVSQSFIYNILLNGAKVASLAILIIIGLKTNAMLFSYLIGIIIALITAFLATRSLIKEFKKSKKQLAKKEKSSELKEIFAYSWPLMFFGFTWQIFQWTDSLLIGFLQNAEQVGFYNAAVPIAFFFNITSALFIQLFFPMITRKFSEGKKNLPMIKQLSKQIGKWLFIVNLPVLLLMFTFPGAFISVLFGKEYIVAENALRLLSVGMFINSVFIVSDRLITMLGKTKIILYNILGVSIFNAILDAILISKYGISGAAIATLISFVILNILLAIQAYKYIKIIPIRRKMLNALAAGIISIAVTLFFKNIIGNGIISLLIISTFFVLFYILLLFLLGALDRNDFMIIKSIKEKVFRKSNFDKNKNL